MELKDLKTAWSKFSSDDASKHQLGEEAIYDLLNKRTKNLIERIDRNIKIGFGVLVLLSLMFVLDAFFFTPRLAASYETAPGWIQWMEGLGILFIAGSFVYFWLGYRSATKDYSQSNDLKKVLRAIIRMLFVYRKLFYLALGILLLVMSVSFVTGLYSGVDLKAHELGTTLADVGSSPEMIKRIVLGIVILLVFIAALFVLFSWGFRKLYGNYIFKLKETLKELNEIE
jgi:succinate dehydrogenase hydrophobic anchor subunit